MTRDQAERALGALVAEIIGTMAAEKQSAAGGATGGRKAGPT